MNDELTEFILYLKETDEKYAFQSKASLIVRLSLFIYMIENHIKESNQIQRKKLFQEILTLYNTTPLVTLDHPHQSIMDGTVVFEYIDSDKKYIFDPEQTNLLQKKTFEIQDLSLLNTLSLQRWYIFAFTLENRLLILDSPQSTTDLIIGRKGTIGNLVPEHPLLLGNQDRFLLKSAGELFITETVDNKEKIIILNNRSGHFKPTAESIELVKDKLIAIGISPKNIIQIKMTFENIVYE